MLRLNSSSLRHWRRGLANLASASGKPSPESAFPSFSKLQAVASNASAISAGAIIVAGEFALVDTIFTHGSQIEGLERALQAERELRENAVQGERELRKMEVKMRKALVQAAIRKVQANSQESLLQYAVTDDFKALQECLATERRKCTSHTSPKQEENES
eukprot:TRINITY_DN2709_c0_g1_i4.p1 TRINITY_DN2709_c0_g1~~TRINITY_DN2709_c0_g1_i4.p1  ORF type:complete len:160 (-),score=9.64 TRINITY_DN2709_c0_g1_i4:142-621(-)